MNEENNGWKELQRQTMERVDKFFAAVNSTNVKVSVLGEKIEGMNKAVKTINEENKEDHDILFGKMRDLNKTVDKIQTTKAVRKETKDEIKSSYKWKATTFIISLVLIVSILVFLFGDKII